MAMDGCVVHIFELCTPRNWKNGKIRAKKGSPVIGQLDIWQLDVQQLDIWQLDIRQLEFRQLDIRQLELWQLDIRQ